MIVFQMCWDLTKAEKKRDGERRYAGLNTTAFLGSYNRIKKRTEEEASSVL
jgi:hypothetical protein